ncbi:DUF4391 domain-containing protein [Desulfocurvus sp. DL9XJH121]
MLFEYPQSAAFGRVLPKSKIYENANPTSAIKELFVRQVEQIVWEYKLATETINLEHSKDVPEIQVFHIALKTGELKRDVLCCIDKAIPKPLLFELHYAGQIRPMAAYKRPSDADKSSWVVGELFEGPWMPDTTPRSPLPLALSLDALYAKLLMPLMPFPAQPGEELRPLAERMERALVTQREIEKCEARLQKERQFNRKVAINAELRDLKQTLENLTSLCP